jgi:hypothetical protein
MLSWDILWTGFELVFLVTLTEWLYIHDSISRAPLVETDFNNRKLSWSAGNILEELRIYSIVIRQNYLTGNSVYEGRVRSNRTSQQIVAQTRRGGGGEVMKVGEEMAWNRQPLEMMAVWWWKPILILTSSCGKPVTTSYNWSFTFIGAWLRTMN